MNVFCWEGLRVRIGWGELGGEGEVGLSDRSPELCDFSFAVVIDSSTYSLFRPGRPQGFFFVTKTSQCMMVKLRFYG